MSPKPYMNGTKRIAALSYLSRPVGAQILKSACKNGYSEKIKKNLKSPILTDFCFVECMAKRT